MRFREVLKANTEWSELVVLDGERIRTFDEMAQYGRYLENYVDDYGDTEVEKYINDGDTLVIMFS